VHRFRLEHGLELFKMMSLIGLEDLETAEKAAEIMLWQGHTLHYARDFRPPPIYGGRGVFEGCFKALRYDLSILGYID